ncbi:hypothetical protein TIFTF001_028943 [Ficus carica]|uniref:Uncharacterized protein n=1 Tax=Ficus carica TaxID=3494 RepID=A0AA88J2P4_FICCA|nr:hypothetical protein TIFTF001_028943 [Ficus carica]
MGLEKEATNNNDNNVVKLIKVINTKRPEIITSQHHIDHDHDHDHDHDDQRFKSGQALGGHKRIHGINNKINNKRKDIGIDHQDHDDEIIGNSSISTQDDHMINYIIIGDGDSSTYVKTPKRQQNLMLSSSSHKTTPPSDHLAAITLMLLAHHDHRVLKNINIDKPLTHSIDSLRSMDHERAATHDTNGDDGGKDIDVPHPKGTASKIVFDFDLNEFPHSEH